MQTTGAPDEVSKPKYTMADLLAQYDFMLPFSEEELQWLDAKAVGEELI